MQNKVSVIIPIYKCEKFIARCLDSLLSQTYNNLEILCVNDCTPDNSVDVISEYIKKDSRIKLINHSENLGAAGARNTGMDNATGEYIYFIDSDDWIDSDYIEILVKAIENANVDIVVNKSILLEENGTTKRHNPLGHTKIKTNDYFEPAPNMEYCFWVVWNRIFKTEFLKKYNLRFPEKTFVEDMFFQYVSFIYADKVYAIDESNYHYFQRSDSISKEKNYDGVAHINILGKIYEYYKEHNFLDRKVKLYGTMPFFIIDSEKSYSAYKKYFEMVIDYLKANDDIYNELDFYFANSILTTTSYEDYISKYSKNPVIGFARRKR